MKEISSSGLRSWPRPDWRSWIALAWVAVWGWIYGTMAFHARAPQVLAWLRTIWK